MQRRYSNTGFTLTEVLTSLAILMISALAVATLVQSGLQFASQKSLLETKDRVIANMVRYVTTPAALRAACYASMSSDKDNVPLNICINGDYPSLAIPCINNAAYKGFRLYLPTVSQVVKGSNVNYRTSSAITGTPEQPMRFTNTGIACDMKTNVCPVDQYPIEAFTEFQPICYTYFEAYQNGWLPRPDPPPPMYPTGFEPVDQCFRARYVRLRLTVRPTGNGTKFKPYQGMFVVDAALVSQARQ